MLIILGEEGLKFLGVSILGAAKKSLFCNLIYMGFPRDMKRIFGRDKL